MCGVAGLVCLDAGCDPVAHEARVLAMLEAQHHRGPDDGGIARAGPVTLGARRLSIIDLSPAGHMPMSDPSGRWWIAYNGEVYNFPTLRSELEAMGHTFRSRTDTEVVLHSFIEWGPDCLHRLVGMFAFAIADRATGELTLVRDRFGIKPLYYTRRDGHFLFASEIGALVAAGGEAVAGPRGPNSPEAAPGSGRAPPQPPPFRVSDRSFLEWLLYRNVDALSPDTLLDGVSSALPGEVLTLRDGRLSRRRAYVPWERVSVDEYRRLARAGPDAIVGEIEELLTTAVSRRLVSDVPVGTLLSGGLDSSLVTSLAARERPDLTAFHVSVAGHPDLDERRHAEGLSRALGLRMETLELTAERFRRAFAQVVRRSDLPLTHPNSVAYRLISQVARDSGTIVLLSGEGADELFGGYRWAYRRRRMLLRLLPVLDLLPEKASSFVALLAYAQQGLPVTAHRFRDALPSTVSALDRYQRLALQEACEDAYAFETNRVSRAVLGGILADLSDFLTPLLRRLDRMTMAASVECRVPFLDHDVVERAIHLPLRYRVGRRADKWILQQVARRHVPLAIATRKKVGFPLPLAEYVAPWAKPELFRDGFCEGVLGLHSRGLDVAVRGWRSRTFAFFGLLALELWGRMFVMGEAVEAVEDRLQALERGGPAAPTSHAG